MINHKLHSPGGKDITLSQEILDKIQEIVKHYPDEKQKSALLPVLHIVQEEFDGYLSVELMDYVAKLLNVKPIEVYEVATFYSMFNLDPVGKYVIDVCQTGPCAISGGEQMLEYIKKKLNISVGETTTDGLFTLHAVECLGACGSAPVLQVNNEFYEGLTTIRIDKLLDDLREIANKKTASGKRWVEKFS